MTYTAMHWGVYRPRVVGGPTRHGPGGMGPRSLADRPLRRRGLSPPARAPPGGAQGLSRARGASREGRGREPFVEVSWDEALDLVADELARVKDKHGNRGDLRRLLRLVERRALPSRAEPGPSLPERDRRLRAPHRHLQPRRRARAAAAHRSARWTTCMSVHTTWNVLAEHCKLFVTFGGAAAQERADQLPAARSVQSRCRRPLRACARGGVRFVNVSADRRRPRHRRATPNGWRSGPTPTPR